MFKKFLSLSTLITLLCSCSTTSKQNFKRFAPCPSSPNCVSSQAIDSTNSYVKPIPYSHKLSFNQVSNIIIKTNLTMPRSKLITNDNEYLHFEFRTALGFVDDVEYQINQQEHLIYFRSAARLGYYDFGKNRARYNEIKEKLIPLLK
ncbi:MAG: hypothetical protein DGJ47_000296 [Rickettsiaceae bacterium]